MSLELSGRAVCYEFNVSSSALYRRFLEERACILENKWYMSEKAGYDVGFERALMDWVMHHRNTWIKSRI